MKNAHSPIGRALVEGVMGTSPDEFAKHLQEHRVGVPAQYRDDCGDCRRQRRREQEQRER